MMHNEITKEVLLSETANFIWMFDHRFFVETKFGNFVWSDPDYNGNDTVTPFKGSYNGFCNISGTLFGRCKGQRLIRDFIGNSFTLKKE